MDGFHIEDPHSIPITQAEEKELRRVYDLLCDFSEKTRLKDEIRSIQGNLVMSKIQAHANARVTTNTKELEIEENNAQEKIDRLSQEIYTMESNPNRKISVSDICEMLKKLKQRVVRKEVQAIVWEVDDDLDQCINWHEFRLMFTRNIMDRTGLEPSKMFNLTQFLIYDHNENGRVSVDETMNMLYARYGRVKMETKLRELFGENMHETGRQGGEISYQEFISSVESVQQNTFWSTTKGKIVSSKSRNSTSKLMMRTLSKNDLEEATSSK